jgi:hypothetical protein
VPARLHVALLAASLVLVIVGTVSQAAAAAPVSGDTRATVVYLRAAYTLESAFLKGVADERTAAAAPVAQVRAMCPAILQSATDQQLGSSGFDLALFDSAALSAFTPLHDAVLRFIGATDSLHWRSRSLTRGVHRRASDDRAEIAIAPLPLCQVAGEWKANGFAALPAAVATLLQLERRTERGDPIGVERALSLLPGRHSQPAQPLWHRLESLQPQLVNEILSIALGPEADARAALTGRATPGPSFQAFPPST